MSGTVLQKGMTCREHGAVGGAPEHSRSVGLRARWQASILAVHWRKWALILPVALYAAVLVLAPLTALVAGALAEGPSGVLKSVTDPSFLRSLRLTLAIGAAVVAVHTVGGVVLAWVLVRDDFRGKRYLDAAVNLPFAVSPVVVGYMLFLIFGRSGLLSGVLDRLGVQIVFAVPGMVLATLFVTLPFMAREVVPVLRAFGTDQEEAASTLGASDWQTFIHVTLPALRWGLIYGLTLTFARALGEFGAVLVVGGGVEGRTETATLYVYRALDERQYVAAYSAALVLGLLSLALVAGTDLLRRRAG